jgi:molecular chaperone DnaK
VNPDEVVAIGAAIQAGVLAGDVKDILLLDVTPLTLGIETLGGVFTKLIDRNTTIPVRKSEIFSTAADNQTSVEVHVLQGEREMAQGNKTLGRFHLEEIPSAQRGTPQIEVVFDLDANGIVHVTAKDLGTGKEQKITITSSSGLEQDSVDQMVKDAEANAEDDKKLREMADARNQIDQMIYATEKTLKDVGEKLPEEDRQETQQMLDSAKAALEEGDIDKIKSAREALEKQAQKMAEVIYRSESDPEQAQAAAADGANDAGAGQDGQQDEIIDAEVIEGENTTK